MKEVVGEDGRTYGLAVAYGVLSSLENLIFEGLSDEMMEKVKNQISAKGGDMEDIGSAALMEFFSGADLRDFLSSNANEGGKIIATVLRTVDGEREIRDEETDTLYNLRIEGDRLDYVNEVLPYPDGEAIVTVVNEILEKFAEGNDQSGKSKLSSNRKGRKAKAASTESS